MTFSEPDELYGSKFIFRSSPIPDFFSANEIREFLDYGIVQKEDEPEIIPLTPKNCRNCGAPVRYFRCEYCGTNA